MAPSRHWIPSLKVLIHPHDSISTFLPRVSPRPIIQNTYIHEDISIWHPPNYRTSITLPTFRLSRANHPFHPVIHETRRIHLVNSSVIVGMENSSVKRIVERDRWEDGGKIKNKERGWEEWSWSESNEVEGGGPGSLEPRGYIEPLLSARHKTQDAWAPRMHTR